MPEEKKDFIVKDRRMFAEEDKCSKEKEEKEEEKKEEKKESFEEKIREQEPEESVAAGKQEEEFCLPEINFSTFIISLNASALLHLGVIGEPSTGKKNKNLPLGKQTIDILNMLEEKTRGNLTKEEEGLFKNILYDLRIAYVKQKG